MTATPEARSFFSRWRWMRRLGCALAVLTASAALLLFAAKKVWDAQFFQGYDSRLALRENRLDRRPVPGGLREKWTLQLTPGKEVPVLFQYATVPDRKIPCLVLLYGIGQKMSFLDEIAPLYVQAGMGLICHEQLGQGERKSEGSKGGWKGLLALRRRASANFAEARRIVDFLETRPEVDPRRIFLFGISFGAITGTAPLAADSRFSGGILMWGGGDLPLLLGGDTGSSRSGKNRLSPWAARLSASLLSPAEPLDWVRDVGPRPLLFQNALADEIIPRRSTEAYFQKAAEPKKILWYSCGHEVGLTKELIQRIVLDQIAWIGSLPPPAR